MAQYYHRWKKPKATLIGKLCKRCKTFKLIDDFSINENARDGHQTYCKECCCKLTKETPAYKRRLKKENYD